MEIVNLFLAQPEVQALEELQDALYDPTQKKVEDFKTILDKFKYRPNTVNKILIEQINHILKIKPKLYATYVTLLSDLQIQSYPAPPNSIYVASNSKLFNIIIKDDVSSFSKFFKFPDDNKKICSHSIPTTKNKQPILKIIVASRAYNILTFLITNDVITPESASIILAYAVRYHDDFLINTFLSLGIEPKPSAFKEAYKSWNFRFLQWICVTYFYKTTIENVEKSGSVKLLRFFSTIDTKRTSTISYQKLYSSLFHIPKEELI